MMMRLATAVFVTVAATAGAWAAEWGMTASACMPANAAVFDRILTIGGQVKHVAGNVGAIVLRCPVNTDAAGGTRVKLLARDSNGAGAGAGVTATLVRQPFGPSPTEVAIRSIATNPQPFTTPHVYISTSFTHTFDFDANNYYVVIDLRRAVATDEVIAFAVEIN